MLNALAMMIFFDWIGLRFGLLSKPNTEPTTEILRIKTKGEPKTEQKPNSSVCFNVWVSVKIA
jgi:hypothetical protein